MAKGKIAPPWTRSAPAKGGHTHLTPAKKAAAKGRAKRAGRHYPNLVDNMREAARASPKKSPKKKKSSTTLKKRK